jgi:ankyrin repeat protein
VESRDNFGCTPYGHLHVSRELINYGADVNASKQDRWTQMHLSARNGHLGLVKLLLERDAVVRVTVENDEGHTPYQLSLGKGYQKMIDLLGDYEPRV